MKLLHWITGLLLLAVLLGGSAYMIASTLGYEQSWVEQAANSNLGRRSAAGVVIAVLVLYGLSAIPSAKDEQFISFENEWGIVNVSIKAVTDFIAGFQENSRA